jgi:hypothetical protein
MNVQPIALLIKIISELSNEYASLRAADFLGFRPAELSCILLERLQNMPKMVICTKSKAPLAAKRSGINVQ